MVLDGTSVKVRRIQLGDLHMGGGALKWCAADYVELFRDVHKYECAILPCHLLNRTRDATSDTTPLSAYLTVHGYTEEQGVVMNRNGYIQISITIQDCAMTRRCPTIT
jgi:hypothetical protein